MLKRINIDEVDERIREFLRNLDVKKNRYLLETSGKPFIALVSPEELEEAAALREYTRKEIERFLREDVLDGKTLAKARELLGEAY